MDCDALNIVFPLLHCEKRIITKLDNKSECLRNDVSESFREVIFRMKWIDQITAGATHNQPGSVIMTEECCLSCIILGNECKLVSA